MNLLSFALGLLSAVVAVVVSIGAIHWFSRERTVDASSIEAREGLVRELFAAVGSGHALHLRWLPSNLEARLAKRARKTLPDTLALEVRFSEHSRGLHEGIRNALTLEGLEFTEKFTPSRNLPRRIDIRWPEGGPLVISSACHVLTLIESTLARDSTLSCTATLRRPLPSHG